MPTDFGPEQAPRQLRFRRIPRCVCRPLIQTLRADAADLGLDAQSRHMELRYEDFCEQPEQHTAAIIDFLVPSTPLDNLDEAVKSENHRFQQAHPRDAGGAGAKRIRPYSVTSGRKGDGVL